MNLQYLCSIVPVMQISLVHGAGLASHEKLDQVLAQLRYDGVLVIGSGSLTHKLHEFRGQ